MFFFFVSSALAVKEDTEDFVQEPNFGSRADLPRVFIKKQSPPQMTVQDGRVMKRKTSKELQRLRSELIEDSLNDEESDDFSPNSIKNKNTAKR